MSALALSVLLSLVSAVAYAGGAIVQERVAEATPDQSYAPMRRPAWWAAVGLNGLGGLLHVVALAFGPLSLVQPLGALTIVFALPMAALFVRRKAGCDGLAGRDHGDGRTRRTAVPGRHSRRAVPGHHPAGGGGPGHRRCGGGLMMAARAAHRHPAVRSVLLAIASGVAFGMSSVFTKTVAVDWTGGFALGRRCPPWP